MGVLFATTYSAAILIDMARNIVGRLPHTPPGQWRGRRRSTRRRCGSATQACPAPWQIRAMILMDRIHQRSPWDRLAPPPAEPGPEADADGVPGDDPCPDGPDGDRGGDADLDFAADLDADDDPDDNDEEDEAAEEDEGRPGGLSGGPPPGSPFDRTGRQPPAPTRAHGRPQVSPRSAHHAARSSRTSAAPAASPLQPALVHAGNVGGRDVSQHAWCVGCCRDAHGGHAAAHREFECPVAQLRRSARMGRFFSPSSRRHHWDPPDVGPAIRSFQARTAQQVLPLPCLCHPRSSVTSAPDDLSVSSAPAGGSGRTSQTATRTCLPSLRSHSRTGGQSPSFADARTALAIISAATRPASSLRRLSPHSTATSLA